MLLETTSWSFGDFMLVFLDAVAFFVTFASPVALLIVTLLSNLAAYAFLVVFFLDLEDLSDLVMFIADI